MGVETIMLAAAVAGAAGTAAEGVNAFSSSRYQASVLANQAEAARHDAGIQAQLVLEDSGRDLATATTIAAKGGGGIEGNALNVLRDLSRQSLYEVQRISVEGDNASRAAMEEAKQAKRQGNFALGSSLVKAGAQIAGASNGTGTGTLLSDAIEKRRARGASAARPTAYGRPISW
jgi:hypothetical protein